MPHFDTRYEQFLLLPQFFKNTYTAYTYKLVIVWEWVNQIWNCFMKRLSLLKGLKFVIW